MARFLNGKQIPDEARVATPPDVQRAHGFYRLLHIVEQHAHEWLEFEFDSERVSKRVKYRIENQITFGSRYEIIQAGRKVFIRLKVDIEPVKEAGTDGNFFKNARIISYRKSALSPEKQDQAGNVSVRKAV